MVQTGATGKKDTERPRIKGKKYHFVMMRVTECQTDFTCPLTASASIPEPREGEWGQSSSRSALTDSTSRAHAL